MWTLPAKHLFFRRPFPSRLGGLKEGAVLQKSGRTDLGWHLFLGFYLCVVGVVMSSQVHLFLSSSCGRRSAACTVSEKSRKFLGGRWVDFWENI